MVPGVARAMQTQGKDKAIPILSLHKALDKQTADANLVFRPIKRFPAAVKDDESYVIYDVRTRQPQ